MNTEKRIDTRKDRTAERAQAGDILKYAGLKAFEIKDADYITALAPTIISILSELEQNNSSENKYGNYKTILETADKIINEYKQNKKENITTRELISAGSILISAGLDMSKYTPKRDGRDNPLHKLAVFATFIAKNKNE